MKTYDATLFSVITLFVHVWAQVTSALFDSLVHYLARMLINRAKKR